MNQKSNRRWGQNFLVASGIARRIVDLAEVSAGDFLLEIGPGRGALTGLLLQKGAHVWAVEIDAALCAVLESQYAENSRFHLVHGDFLHCDIRRIFDSATPGTGWKLVSNLPYNEGTAILRRLIDFKPRLRQVTVMLQREVADRLLAGPGNREIGFLTHLMSFHFSIRRGFNVSPGAFRPVPKVRSTVLQLIPREQVPPLSDYPFYVKLLEFAFRQRRKTLQNALSSLPVDPIELPALLEQRGLPAKARPEALSPQDFIWIAQQLASHRR